MNQTALIVVDMQKYYLHKNSDFYRYAESQAEGCMDYIEKRARETVVPNLKRLIDFFRKRDGRIIYLKLCGKKKSRKDLHRFFYTEHLKAASNGYSSLYPLIQEQSADVLDELQPAKEDKVFTKTTFSAFSSTTIAKYLTRKRIGTCIFTGLATSQCVETTARDASDFGCSIIHIEDAQADYTPECHYNSLYSSRSVCGSWIYGTDDFIFNYESIIKRVHDEEYSIPF